MRAVIDTNVLLVANGQHDGVSDDCVRACVAHLQVVQKSGIVVIDDNHRILGEYKNNLNRRGQPQVGDVFLRWLLQNVSNSSHVEQVALTEKTENCFEEFPGPELEPKFDAPDRKFAAVANAHPQKPPISQAADCKWLDWWQALRNKGIEVKFLCPDDICGFYRKKFPDSICPDLPE